MILVGDNRERLRELGDATIDAVVTDPPYGLEFMGKEWDAPWKSAEIVTVTDEATNGIFHSKGFSHGVRFSRGSDEMRAFQAWCTEWAAECLRLLKPGGHLLAFGGSRTYHRLACAIEDAGFEIRDQIMWVYGSGFPKSLDVSKAIDKMHGVKREIVGLKHNKSRVKAEGWYFNDGDGDPITVPASDDARRWQGWGTALKPAHEPIVVARKPLDGTVANNVLQHGTGALNIDGCRVGTEGGTKGTGRDSTMRVGDPSRGFLRNTEITPLDAGRWPANFIHDGSDEVLELFPETKGGAYPEQRGVGRSTDFGRGRPTDGGARSMGDGGSAARFFYCAKASRAEREAGLDDFDPKRDSDRTADDLPGGDNPRNRTNTARRNHHPTVKPVALMRYLVRLVTPPGGLVLDPFTGSGTTGIAARLEGCQFIGIELSPEYAEIAQARIDNA